MECHSQAEQQPRSCRSLDNSLARPRPLLCVCSTTRRGLASFFPTRFRFLEVCKKINVNPTFLWSRLWNLISSLFEKVIGLLFSKQQRFKIFCTFVQLIIFQRAMFLHGIFERNYHCSLFRPQLWYHRTHATFGRVAFVWYERRMAARRTVEMDKPIREGRKHGPMGKWRSKGRVIGTIFAHRLQMATLLKRALAKNFVVLSTSHDGCCFFFFPAFFFLFKGGSSTFLLCGVEKTNYFPSSNANHLLLGLPA